MARIRKNVWKLDPQDETLVWYARAVGAMKQKLIADPTSWRYQAAIHEYPAFRGVPDPLATPGDVMPLASEQKAFWNQCQHGSWYFLPWHRMYLHYFEQIVTAEVVKQNGPADWALPYWNYSADDASRLLPTAFRNPNLSDGSPNPLYVSQRDPLANAGQQFADTRDTDLSVCLKQPSFNSSSVGGDVGFGGPVTKFQHGGGTIGTLEDVPHGTIHGAVGGSLGPHGGWMSQFYTAALDPIFWLHHSNIDRLWQVWLNRNSAFKNPTTAKWLTSVSFQFHDASGQIVTMKPADVVDSTTDPLSYTYDDVSDPLAAPQPLAAIREIAMATPPKKKPAEMVGATDSAFEIGATTTHAVMPLQAKPATLTEMQAPLTEMQAPTAPPPRRTFLNIENLTSTRPAPAYDVYLNVPVGSDPTQHEEHFAGRIAMFGLVETSSPSDQHPGSGLHYALDVTDLVKRLSAQPGWDPSHLRVSFVPTRNNPDAKVRVGRVSLYME